MMVVAVTGDAGHANRRRAPVVGLKGRLKCPGNLAGSQGGSTEGGSWVTHVGRGPQDHINIRILRCSSQAQDKGDFRNHGL